MSKKRPVAKKGRDVRPDLSNTLQDELNSQMRLWDAFREKVKVIDTVLRVRTRDTELEMRLGDDE